MSGMHSHDGVHFHASHGHSHDLPAADHGHTHEVLDGPGSYMGREMPIIEGRDWSERAFTVGIGGYVSGRPSLCFFIAASNHVLETVKIVSSPLAFTDEDRCCKILLSRCTY
jgi:urease accessory protein